MWMTELATNTITAATKMGTSNDITGTMGHSLAGRRFKGSHRLDTD
jgi:hypothetical protein